MIHVKKYGHHMYLNLEVVKSAEKKIVQYARSQFQHFNIISELS